MRRAVLIMPWSLLGQPRLALLLLVSSIGLPALLLPFLQINNSPDVYLPADAPPVQMDSDLRERFPEDEVLVLLFRSSNLYSTGFLSRYADLTASLERHPAVERALSVTSMERISGTDDGFSADLLIDTSGESSADSWRQRVLEDRFAPGLVASRDGESLGIVVRPQTAEGSMQRLQLESAVRELVTRHELDGELTAVAGAVALDVAQLRSMLRDNALFVPATLAIGLGLLWWLFRRLLVLGIALATIGSGIYTALAVLAVTGSPFTLVGAIIPPLLTALAIAILMHLFNDVAHAANLGHTGARRILHAMDNVRRPILYTMLTTSCGLLSLTASPIPPIAMFGLSAATGLMMMTWVVLVLVPPILLTWDRGPWRIPRGGGLQRLDRVMRLSTRLALRHPLVILSLTALLVTAGATQIWRIQAETDLYTFFGEDHQLIRDTRTVEKHLTGVTALEVVFDAPSNGELTDRERLDVIGDFAKWASNQNNITYVMAMTDFIEEMHWGFHEEKAAYRTLPDSGEAAAQYLFIYDGDDLYDVVGRELTRTRVLLNLELHGAREISQVMDDIRTHLAGTGTGDLRWEIAGMGRLFADQERLLIQGQLHSILIAAFVVFLLMAVFWRSVGAALLCMIPNMAPVALIFSLMGALGIWLDMATAMIASVAIGIAVDDTIHVYHRYRDRRLRGAPRTFAFARAYRESGRAITATTLVLSAQFFMLGLSAFSPTAAFGMLTALGLVAALIFDLLVLPALVIVLSRLREVTPFFKLRGNST